MIETRLHGNFKNIYLNNELVVTPQLKAEHFVKVFQKGLKGVIDGTIENVSLIDALTFQIDLKIDEKNKKVILKQELEKLRNDLKSDFMNDNFESIENSILNNNGMVNKELIRTMKKGLLGSFLIEIDTLFDNVDLYPIHSEVISRVFKIREQEGKLFKFINKSVLGTLKTAMVKIPNYKAIYQLDLEQEVTNIQDDFNKLTNVYNVKSAGTYYITMDSNKIMQCSYNTGDKWRSCYKLDDGEYRGSAVYVASHEKVGMLYSLTNDGYIKNRRLFTVEEKGIMLGKWYPNQPKGLDEVINIKIAEMLNITSVSTDRTNAYEPEDTWSQLRDKNIYFDFKSNNCDLLYQNNSKARTKLKNVYNHLDENKLFNTLRRDKSLRFKDTQGNNHYFEVR